MNTQLFFFKLCLLQKVSLGIKAQDKLGAASGSIFIVHFFSIYFVIGIKPDFIDFCFIY